MSSPRKTGDCCAVIKTENAKVAGAVVLPDSAPEDFIAEFNRTYASIGWTVESLNRKKTSTSVLS